MIVWIVLTVGFAIGFAVRALLVHLAGDPAAALAVLDRLVWCALLVAAIAIARRV